MAKSERPSVNTTREISDLTFKTVEDVLQAMHVPGQWEFANGILKRYGVVQEKTPFTNGEAHILRETKGLKVSVEGKGVTEVFLREMPIVVEGANTIQVIFKFEEELALPNYSPAILQKGLSVPYKIKQLLEMIEREEEKRKLNPDYTPYIYIRKDSQLLSRRR